MEIPDFVAEVVERIAFLARGDKRIDQRSGVSQRVPITLLESVVSNAERRALLRGEESVVPRIGDIFASISTITGKLELEYEGELHGAENIARELISRAAADVFQQRVGDPPVDEIVEYFEGGSALQVSDDAGAAACVEGFRQVPGLVPLVESAGLAGSQDEAGVLAAGCELVLEALVAERRISRAEGGRYGRARE